MMLKHIELEIQEEDLQRFYINIFKSRITRQLNLSKVPAKQIFQIEKRINFYTLGIGILEFELFIHNSVYTNKLKHLRIEIEDGGRVFKSVSEKRHWTHAKKRNPTETYFFKDQNGNLFEIKNNEC
jgi:hypothetical protein